MSWDPEDEIGYGKPPRYTRFPKGRSGNPNGRPRKAKAFEAPPSTNFDDVLRELSNEKVTVKLGGKVQKIPAFKAVALRQRADALSGSVTAQREISRNKEKLDERDALRELAEAEKRKAEAIKKEKNKLLMYDFLVHEHATQTKVYKLAADTGTDPDPKYPHPDDFQFDHNAQTATIRGPFDESDEPHFLRLAKERDYHFVHYVILNRQRPKGSKLHRRIASFSMCSFDLMLPKRQRLQGEGWNDMLEILFRLPMADLREWRRDLSFWLKLNPLPELDKKGRKEVYKEVNAAMKPILKPMGFRSLAQFERHCADEEELERKVAISPN